MTKLCLWSYVRNPCLAKKELDGIDGLLDGREKLKLNTAAKWGISIPKTTYDTKFLKFIIFGQNIQPSATEIFADELDKSTQSNVVDNSIEKRLKLALKYKGVES